MARFTKWWCHLLKIRPDQLRVDGLHVSENNFDSRQDDTRIDVLELRCDTFADVLRLLDIDSRIVGQSGQECNPSPFCAFIQGHEKLLESGRCNDERSRLWCCLVNLGQRLDRVGDNHRVGITNQLLQSLQKAVLDAQ